MASLASARVPRPRTRHSCALVVVKTLTAGVRTMARTSPRIPQRNKLAPHAGVVEQCLAAAQGGVSEVHTNLPFRVW